MEIAYSDKAEISKRNWAARWSLIIGAFLLGVKFWAYKLTHSQAVFSDAMESIVNVVAAILVLSVVAIASQPADEDHPYGHGKFEFFSAAFEGGLIAFAAAVILVEAVESLWQGQVLNHLSKGLYIVAGAGIINLLLGLYLVAVGKRSHSPSLNASGKHLITDFWTSVAVVLGLLVVHLTGLLWLDPVIAIIVGVNLALIGIKLVQDSFGGLVDKEDRSLLAALRQSFSDCWSPGIIRVHHTRIIRSGSFHHIDAHVVIPEFWDVLKAHDETEKFEQKIIKSYKHESAIRFHVDPCRRAYCRVCDLENCPVRKQDFEARIPLTVDEIVNPDEPPEFT